MLTPLALTCQVVNCNKICNNHLFFMQEIHRLTGSLICPQILWCRYSNLKRLRDSETTNYLTSGSSSSYEWWWLPHSELLNGARQILYRDKYLKHGILRILIKATQVNTWYESHCDIVLTDIQYITRITRITISSYITHWHAGCPINTIYAFGHSHV